MDASVVEICRQAKITDYLTARGHTLIRAGKRMRCCCPLHEEKIPSFYITTMPDGGEVWHCFGACNQGGGIVGLKALLEKTSKREALLGLAAKFNVVLGKFVDEEHLEPNPDRVLTFFCQEDDLAISMADKVVAFLKNYQTEDAVNKISRVYEALDGMSSQGEPEKIAALLETVMQIIEDYEPVEKS
jgi:DNA primase